MSIQITDHPPRTRCYKCGSTNVEAVCHHCHRAMCALHIREPIDSKGRLISVEFTGLGLEEACGEVPIHCEFCHHVVHSPHAALAIAGIGIFFLALLLPLNISTRFIGILLGGAMTGLGFYINKTRTEKLIQSRPHLPLLPRFSTIQIREIVRGKINLDSKGDYHISISSAEGIFTITSNFGKAELDQLEQYQKKYHLAESQDIQFNSGFVVLQSASGIDYLNNISDTVLALRGTQPFSTKLERYRSGERPKSRRYNLSKVAIKNSFPIRIVPSLIQEAAKRALDLEIQWTGENRGINRLRVQKIDLLDLQVPVEWGEIQDANGGIVGRRTSFEDGNIVHTITWHGVPVTDNDLKKCQHTFSISFEDAIEASNSICGTLVATFRGTVSDIEGISVFYPLGRQRELESTVISTQVIVDFELSLAGLRYQDIRVVPDLKKDKDKLEPIVVKGITPDHDTVIALTNAISERFYIKRIIENPPRIGERANLVNRYWDIAGRYYVGVYPIDYHLMLSGEIIKGDELYPHSGMTKVHLNVQGAYANKEMEETIENLWVQLSHLIRTTLEQLSRTKSSVSQNNDQFLSSFPPQSLNIVSNTDGRIERITALRKRLDDLFELLISGHLSEETFLNLKLETEKEIQTIQSKTQFN
jgi:hypothetical protein